MKKVKKNIEIEKSKARCAGMLKGFTGKAHVINNKKKNGVNSKRDIKTKREIRFKERK